MAKSRTGQRDEKGEIITPESWGEEFAQTWEKLAKLDATREDRINYFRLTSPTLGIYGMLGIVAFMILVPASMFLSFFGYWLILLPTIAGFFFTIRFGHERELKKSSTDENYLASFDTAKLTMYSVVGAVVGSCIGYGLISALMS